METKQRLWDIDDVWELYCQRSNDHLRFELIDGELIEMSGPGGTHGRIAIILGTYLYLFAEENDLGIVTGETGYHPPADRYNLLLPDVAFISFERAPDPFPDKLVPVMPDLAVEIRSPSNTLAEMREKAQRYLRLGTTLIWIILPNDQKVEIHQTQMPVKTLALGDSLSGEDVLPGFELELRWLFP
ncbi:MAG: Uma2 family endonuclease [Chloroflexi bacterium]|nr:Uma2 family endonuclease [Chloroflexota bacterium]